MMPRASLTPENDESSSNNTTNTIQSLSIQAGINNNEDDEEEYQDLSTNDLSMFTGAVLLTADCMGTGILALPADVQLLGRGWGIVFLLFNLLINLYAGGYIQMKHMCWCMSCALDCSVLLYPHHLCIIPIVIWIVLFSYPHFMIHIIHTWWAHDKGTSCHGIQVKAKHLD